MLSLQPKIIEHCINSFFYKLLNLVVLVCINGLEDDVMSSSYFLRVKWVIFQLDIDTG